MNCPKGCGEMVDGSSETKDGVLVVCMKCGYGMQDRTRSLVYEPHKEKFIICWKYKDKSGRGTRKYETRLDAELAIKHLNPDIIYWVESAEQRVQSDLGGTSAQEASPNEKDTGEGWGPQGNRPSR